MKKSLRVLLSISLILIIMALLLIVACAEQSPAPTPAPTPAPKPAPAPTPAPKPAEPIVLKAATFLPVSNLSIKGNIPVYIDMVSNKSGGELTIDLLGGPEVMPGREQFDAVKKGILDIAFLPPAYYEAAVPEAHSVLYSQISLREEHEIGYYDLLNEYAEKENIYQLGRCIWGPMYIWTTEPFDNILDLNGKLIRMMTGPYDGFFNILGITRVDIPIPEVYSALQQGVVDGAGQPMASAVSMRWTEVLKYCLDEPILLPNGVLTIMNLNTFNKLPKNLQDVLYEVQLEYESYMQEHFIKLDEEMRGQAETEFGVTFVKPSAADSKWFQEAGYMAGLELYKQKVTPEHYEAIFNLIRK
ncbi:TRAP transporter substrate-binding protein DctP [Chloroflexota bacterium]